MPLDRLQSLKHFESTQQLLHPNVGSTETKTEKDIDTGHIDMRGKYEQTLDYIGKYSPVSIPG